MAKIVLCGEVYVLISELKVEDIKAAQKLCPDALVIKNEDGEPVFGVSYGGYGSISKNGVCFDGNANDGTGRASITCPIPKGTEDIIGTIVDVYAPVKAGLLKIEETLPEVLAAVRAERATTAEEIQVLA